VGETCNMHGIDEKYIQNFNRKTGREEVTWKTLSYMGGYY
jgi:hypothetical protein